MHFREENKFRVIFENVNEKRSENVREKFKILVKIRNFRENKLSSKTLELSE